MSLLLTLPDHRQCNLAYITVMPANKNNLSEFLTQARKKQNLTRSVISTHSGVGKTTLYDLEHGKETVGLDKFLKVAKTLGIRIHLEDAHGDKLILEAK